MTIKSILIIEDDRTGQVFMKSLIEDFDSNIEVLQAYNGIEALNILRDLEREPDLIILDLVMPDMDGLDFLKRYSPFQQAPIVAIVTANDDGKNKDLVLDYDCVIDYRTKPISNDFLNKLESLITDGS